MSLKPSLVTLAALAVTLAALAVATGGGHRSARAQAFGPPMTVFGSVTDEQGAVPEGLAIEAFVGSRICGTGVTEYTGEPPGRVTVYFVHVVSNDQTAGCGTSGEPVRIKIGDRFAPQTINWEPGPRQMDIVFGNASPAPIPTFTPTPSGTASSGETQTPPTPTPGPPGSPGASPNAIPSPSSSPSASASATVAQTATPTSTPTLAGGLATRPPDSGSGSDDESSDDDGFPVWGMVLIGLGTLVAAGGGIGFAMARARRGAEADADDAPDQ